MATEQDYRLKPQDNEMSQVICNLCDTPIGEVYVAQQTTTGRDTGRSEIDVTKDALEIAEEHVHKCVNRDEKANPAEFSNDSANRPPQTAPLDKRR